MKRNQLVQLNYENYSTMQDGLYHIIYGIGKLRSVNEHELPMCVQHLYQRAIVCTEPFEKLDANLDTFWIEDI